MVIMVNGGSDQSLPLLKGSVTGQRAASPRLDLRCSRNLKFAARILAFRAPARDAEAPRRFFREVSLMRSPRKYAPSVLSAIFLLVSFSLSAQAPRATASPGVPATAV